MNTARLSLDNIDRYGEYPCMWFEGRSWTNVQAYRHASRLAQALLERGVIPGDRVLVMMLNSPHVTASFTAVWKIGGVIVPVTPMLGAREVRYLIEDSGAKVIITSPELCGRLLEACSGQPGLIKVLVFGRAEQEGVTDVSGELASSDPFEGMIDRASDELALLLYTSGTTGVPKGVKLTHENLLFVADACYRLNEHLGQLRTMQVLPLSHVYGVLVMNLGARMGSAVQILKHFDAKAVLETIESFRVQRLALVPTMLTLLINQPDREQFDVSSLETVNSGGAPLSEATRLEFSRLFNCRVVQGYGLSETAGGLSGYHPDDDYRVGSVGSPLPGVEVCVMDFDNRVLPPGEIGELCTRGRHVMQGYYHNDQASKEAIVDGWLHTGDIGYTDADGYIYITDRKKDLIIKGGENISPREIEEAIYSNENIAEAAVLGVADDIYGENIVAAVVLKPGRMINEADLVDYLGDYLSKFKIPSRIFFPDSLPKNASGKILKRVLREQLA
jgi:long-chain acyl-CoA synthetase